MWKKTIVTSIIVLCLIYSCKKNNYVCSCQYTNSNGTVITATHDLNTNNLAQADSQCKGFEVSVQGGFTFSCGVQ